MGKFNFSPDLFLGQQELEAFQLLVKEDFKLFIKSTTQSFGLLNNINPDNFKIEAGSSAGQAYLPIESYAIDKDANFIKCKPQYFTIPESGGNIAYWVKARFTDNPIFASIESGTVTLNSSGLITGAVDSLTGESTEFLSKLRGLPDAPTKIKFFKTGLQNNKEYQVLSVNSDTEAYLMGDFTGLTESDLKYAVVGSFSPLSFTSEANKYPYRYNSCTPFSVLYSTVVAETSENSTPSLDSGYEFFLARIKNNEGVLTIEDKRSSYHYIKA